ncbi:MAG TPA: hypothetical protein VF128_03905 [Gemmatimonadaceae bacterium]
MLADPESGKKDGGTNPGSAVPDGVERRRDPLFRSLIDDMMQQIRELRAHAGPWPPDERAQVEADLERIMAQVRNAALRSGE